MTNNEAATWIQLYIDIAKIDPLTGEAAYLNNDDRKMIEAFDMAINAMTTQPETREERTETHSCDLISKASVCEILADIYPTDGEKVVAVKEVDKAYEAIQRLPSAQPDLSSYSDKLWRNAYERGRKDAVEEIIHCRDCKNWDKTWTDDFPPNYHYCSNVDGIRDENFYCADAERREE